MLTQCNSLSGGVADQGHARQFPHIRPINKGKTLLALATLVLSLTLFAQFGHTQNPAPKIPNVSVPPGYFLHAITTGLDFPTAIATSANKIWVSEAGILPGFPAKVKAGQYRRYSHDRFVGYGPACRPARGAAYRRHVS